MFDSEDVDSLVIIRIWKPEKFGEIGHVSLETKVGDSCGTKPHGALGIYASIWPEQKTFMTTFFDQSPVHSKLHDDLVHYDDRNPEIYEIRTLDVKAINEAYKVFRKIKCNWNLLGSSIFKSKENQNCSGLVFYLLQQGDAHIQSANKNQKQIDLIDSEVKSNISGAIYAGGIGLVLNFSLKVFNTLGTFVMSNFGKAKFNLCMAFALWVVLSKVSSSTMQVARKLTVVTPNDIVNVLKNAGAEMKNNPDQNFIMKFNVR